MPNYRRLQDPGATWFFTVTLADRRSSTLVQNMDALRAAFRAVMGAHPFQIDAIVVLPEHLHCVWTLPEGDTRYGMRWALLKAAFSRRVPGGEHRTVSRRARGERGLWQRRFWEHRIRDSEDLRRHVDYVHWNPVKHGWVARVADWPYSSFHRYVRAGVYSAEWGGNADEPAAAGE